MVEMGRSKEKQVPITSKEAEGGISGMTLEMCWLFCIDYRRPQLGWVVGLDGEVGYFDPISTFVVSEVKMCRQVLAEGRTDGACCNHKAMRFTILVEKLPSNCEYCKCVVAIGNVCVTRLDGCGEIECPRTSTSTVPKL